MIIAQFTYISTNKPYIRLLESKWNAQFAHTYYCAISMNFVLLIGENPIRTLFNC